MKKVGMVLVVLMIIVSIYGQILNSPESIAYDYSTEWRYISNNGNGSIIRDHNDGQYSYFFQGLGGARGLYIHEQTLYAATNLGLSIFDLTTEQHITDVSIPGSVFVNDVVADNDGNIYLSDTQGNKIFKYVISTGQVSTFINTGIQSPNGMVFDTNENRILLVSFRANSPIQAINLPGGEVSTVLTTTIGNLDGIGIDMNGAVYFSSWQTNSVYRLTDLTAVPQQIWANLSGPADFFLYEDTLIFDTGLQNDCQIWIPKMNSNAIAENELPNIVNFMCSVGDAYWEDDPYWVSNFEYNLLGYNLYQGGSGVYFEQALLINPEIIPAQNTVSAVYNLLNYEGLYADYLWLEAIENDGASHLYGPLFYAINPNSNDTQPPAIYDIDIFPNPIHDNAFIKLTNEKAIELNIRIYDVKGRRISSKEAFYASGRQDISLTSVGFNSQSLPTGVYFCRVESGETQITKKFLLIK